METYEGVILVLGGVWLIAQVGKQSKLHPVNVALANSSLQSQGATPAITGQPPSTPSLETGNQAQSTGGMVNGEPLQTPLPTVGNTPILPAARPAPIQVGAPPWIPKKVTPVAPVRRSPGFQSNPVNKPVWQPGTVTEF
jgi:hypothetical protein